MKNKNRQLLLHIIGSIAFLSLPVLFSPDISWSLDFTKVKGFQRDFVTYALLLLFFYLNYFYFVPTFYLKKKYLLFFLCVFACYIVITFLPGWMIQDIGHFAGPPSPKYLPGPGFPPGGSQPFSPPPRFINSREVSQHLFQFLIVLILSILIRINNSLKQSEKEKINAELSYLKAQINPHFLFNTLNSIYSSAIEENADNTASAIVKLSGMMRYVISETHGDFVSLEKEISYISDYLELQQIRLGNTVDLSYQVNGNPAGKKIAPLILISFIENAFKHGVNPEEHSAIKINIDVKDDELFLKVLNRKVSGNSSNELMKGGIGLENTRARLQLLYPSNHELEITDSEKEFVVSLKITRL